YSWMLSAIGTGALLGALAVASYGTPARRQLFLVLGVLVGVASLAGLALARWLPVAVACCALSGGGLILFFATGQATMQLGAGEPLLSRGPAQRPREAVLQRRDRPVALADGPARLHRRLRRLQRRDAGHAVGHRRRADPPLVRPRPLA